MADKALDLFWLLGQLDQHKPDIFAGLTPEQQKEVSCYMVLRWLSGTDNPEQIIELGTIGTSCVFELGQHPELLLQVLAACTRDGTKRYRWLPWKGIAKDSKGLELVMTQWNLSASQAKEALKVLTTDDLIAIAEGQGMQPAEVKALKKELTK